ncbi:MAG: hypothetical protein M3P85_10715 [Actinomycetota bacterium]|nr:hypothetical protein [Actinomycetota bacterium]
MALPLDLPADIARRVQQAASARGVSPEQVVLEAVEAQLAAEEPVTENPLESISTDLQRMAFDGSLRSEIDAVVDDPELAVG